MKQLVKNKSKNNLFYNGKTYAHGEVFEIDSSLFSPFLHENVQDEKKEKKTTVKEEKKK